MHVDLNHTEIFSKRIILKLVTKLLSKDFYILHNKQREPQNNHLDDNVLNITLLRPVKSLSLKTYASPGEIIKCVVHLNIFYENGNIRII